MSNMNELMQQAARDEMKSWSVGQVVDFQLAMQRISLSVIAQAVFGLSDPDDVQRTQQLSADYMNSLNPLMLFFPLLRKE